MTVKRAIASPDARGVFVRVSACTTRHWFISYFAHTTPDKLPPRPGLVPVRVNANERT